MTYPLWNILRNNGVLRLFLKVAKRSAPFKPRACISLVITYKSEYSIIELKSLCHSHEIKIQ